MSHKPFADVDVDELMRRIRREVEARKAASASPAAVPGSGAGVPSAPAPGAGAPESPRQATAAPRYLRLFEDLLAVSKKTTAFVRGLAGQMAALATEQKALAADRAALRREMQEGYAQLDGFLKAVEKQVYALADQASRQAHDIAYVKGDLTLQRLVLARVVTDAGSESSSAATPPHAPANGVEESNDVGPFYLALEGRFRGSREDIKQRLRVYLDRLQGLSHGERGLDVVDIGAGRGEWLELLREHSHRGVGTDLNGAMVRECQARGLDVVQQDAVEFLRRMPDGSVDVVTAFHVIEHLAFAPLMALIQESFRVLRPGGLVIFETPNPDNLLVASRTFYLDPSHRHVVPSPYAAFLLDHVGFREVEIVPLHPNSQARPLALSDPATADVLNQLLYGPQDYAAVGTR